MNQAQAIPAIIDTHTHLHDEKFTDLDEVLNRAKSANISHMITIGCDIATTKNAAALAQKYPHIYYSAGFHPHDAKDLTDETYIELKKLSQGQKCVAIGEIGLDYYYLHSTKDEQQAAFIKQLELAKELNLPVIIHLRDAFDDCVELLKSHAKRPLKVIIHCFSGTLAQAEHFVSLGCLISLSGIVTFKKPGELLDVAKNIPLKNLVIETDCPYLAPHPFRGQRNEPAMIVNTLKTIADARGQDINIVAQKIWQNSLDFFGLGER